MNKPIVIPSPNKKRKAILTYLGKTPAGREYFSLAVEGIPLSLQNRVFGHVCLWSSDSRFLSVQEWRENDPAAGAKSYFLIVLDLFTRRECLVAEVEGNKSEITPQGFIGDSLLYSVTHDGQFGITKDFESNFQHLASWQTLK